MIRLSTALAHVPLRTLVACLVVATNAAPARGQDAHYSTYQFGPRGNLLGGAVVGSAVDVSATFYNPGALARLDSIDLIATSQVFELTNLVFDTQGAVSLNDLRLDEAPGFFGGTLPFSFLGSQVLAYSIFTRYRFKTRLGETRVASLDEPALQGDALLKLRLDRDLSEQWFGLTYAAPKGQFGLGITQFIAYRSQKGKNSTLGEIFPGRGGGGITLVDDEFSYWNTRILWKAGASFDWAGYSIGLTATTPSINLFGSGRIEVNRTVFGQDLDGDSIPDPIFVADAQTGLSPTYKSPWSVGAGVTFRRVGTNWYLSGEYHGKVGEYVVLDGGDFVGQSTGDTIPLLLDTEVDDVLNFNMGVERRFSRRYTGYASFWSDFSSRPDDRSADLAVSRWNILFVSVGAALRLGGADITLGFAYGWGRAKDVSPPRDGIDDEIIGDLLGNADLGYRSLRMMIAFSI